MPSKKSLTLAEEFAEKIIMSEVEEISYTTVYETVADEEMFFKSPRDEEDFYDEVYTAISRAKVIVKFSR